MWLYLIEAARVLTPLISELVAVQGLLTDFISGSELLPATDRMSTFEITRNYPSLGFKMIFEKLQLLPI